MKAVFEKISNPQASTVTAFSYKEDHFSAPWHYHPECELTCILESEGIRYIGNHISEYQPMDLVLLGENLPHRWKNSDDSTSKASALVIQWSHDIVPEVVDLQGIQMMMANAKKGIFFGKVVAQEILPLMQKMLKPEGNKYIQLLKLLQRLSLVSNYQHLSGDDFSPDLSWETGHRLDIIQHYIEAHYTEKITLSDVAELVSLTESSFSRFFSRVMKKPFFSFINEYRVNRASKLLIETNASVAEIGFSCGYESLPYFYKQFKKIKGYSPLVFRKVYHRESDERGKMYDRFVHQEDS
ncbi:AraC-like DNA-binding protein [Catalinimonas alkaloidigena]|uniref:AraC family transcriptional regulator n=1 Tax=Catalinimonas alkaloidigena TaxID=1075417 RepID=UPI0024076C5E|nr:AraC family transcriptional regulator [Catalinimonas alkaloidigena]MDF9796452.1 AraC-like DNA-binding protein [Catalinimonas alkaloidigena]